MRASAATTSLPPASTPGSTLQAVEPLVLERTERLTVVQASFGWSDQGSWLDVGQVALADGDVDRDGNVLEGDVDPRAGRNCTVVSRSGRSSPLPASTASS